MLLQRGRDELMAEDRLGPGYGDPDTRLRRVNVTTGTRRNIFEFLLIEKKTVPPDESIC